MVERLQAELDLERRRLKTSESLRTGLVAEIERMRRIVDEQIQAEFAAKAEIERLRKENEELRADIKMLRALTQWKISD